MHCLSSLCTFVTCEIKYESINKRNKNTMSDGPISSENLNTTHSRYKKNGEKNYAAKRSWPIKM